MNAIITDYDRRRAEAAGTISDLVSITLGPYGQNVDFHQERSRPLMFRDGFRVLQQFDPTPSILSAVLIRMREIAFRTMDNSGDGTTTTTIMLSKVFNSLVDSLAIHNMKDAPISRREVADALRYYGAQVIGALNDMAIKVDLGTAEGMDVLLKVATLSGGNRPEVGRVMVDIISQIGIDGQVTTEVKDTYTEIGSEVRSGCYHINAGLISPKLLPPASAQAKIENACVVMVKSPLNNQADMKPIIEKWRSACDEKGQMVPLVLFCGAIDGDAKALMTHRTDANHNVLPWYTISIQGDHTVWEDLEAVTGGHAFSSIEGRSHRHKHSNAYVFVDSIIAGLQKTTASIGESEATGALIGRIQDASVGMEKEQRKAAEERIARLQGKVGVIKVPLSTSAKISWLSEVLEDSYKATVAAVRGGVLPGAGTSFIRAASVLDGELASASQKIAIDALKASMYVITEQLMTNGGIPLNVAKTIISAMPGSHSMTLSLDGGFLFNVMNGALSTDYANANANLISSLYVNAIEAGILDAKESLVDAVYAATQEAADWIETAVGVIPSSFKEAKSV